jgi:alanine racemase
VVKANAYGHGEREVVRALEKHVDCFQVDDADELARVRKVTKKPILVLGYVAHTELSRAIKLGCELAIYSLEQAHEVESQARKIGVRQKVHVAIDAHLGREGVMPRDAKVFFAEIKKLKHLDVVGMYAHFANIEDTTNPSHAKKQMKAFDSCVAVAKASGFKNIMNTYVCDVRCARL